MRVCPECGTRYADQAGFCPMDGSRLGDVRETEAASEVQPSAPASAPAGGWSGFSSWPSAFGPAPSPSPRFAPPPRPTPQVVEVIEVIEPEAAPVIEERALEAPIAIDRPPSAPHSSGSGPSHSREPTMRWQPSASGPRPVANWTAAAAAIQPPAPEPSAVEPAGWQRPAWLAVAPADADGEPEEELIGRVLAERYRIEARIGSGGMGVVYRATHVLIGKRVAIKVLRRRFARQTEVAQRFAQEARVASSIKHANVVEISDFGTTPNGSPFCVMEHLEGHSLSGEIDRTGRIEPALALDLAIQVVRGLAAAHQAGVVHRDLKPDNVFLIRGESDAGLPVALAKILDFGIARVAGKTRLTAAGSVIGTPEYMSPEQARGDEVDGRSDLYSLGVMLFELLTGRVPFQADSLAGTITKQLFEPPPQLREIDSRLDGLPSIEAVLVRLLAKSREDRPPDALAVARLLQAAAVNDLGLPYRDSREQPALEGWSPVGTRGGQEPPRTRRSTIMIGSGAITSAHTAVRVGDGPATGDFDARDVDDLDHGKRPSVIVRDGSPDATPARARPARLLAQTRSEIVHPAMIASQAPANVPAPTRSPTPEPEPSREVRRRKRRRARRRHLPIVLLAAGAAVFAALVTIGVVQWWQRNAHESNRSTEGVRE